MGQLRDFRAEIVLATDSVVPRTNPQFADQRSLGGQRFDNQMAVVGPQGPPDPHKMGIMPAAPFCNGAGPDQPSGASGGDVPAGSPGVPGGSSSFGDPEAKLKASMDRCLADTFLHAVGLNEQLKESRAQTARAMEIGSVLRQEGGKVVEACQKLAAERDELHSHAAALAAQASANAAAAANAASQAHAAETTMAGALTRLAATEQRAATAERQLSELAAAVEYERPGIVSQLTELADLRARMPALAAELAAAQLTSAEEAKANGELKSQVIRATSEIKTLNDRLSNGNYLYTQLEVKLNQSCKDLSVEREARKELETKFNTAFRENRELLGTIDHMRATLDGLRAKTETAESEMDTLRAQLASVAIGGDVPTGGAGAASGNGGDSSAVSSSMVPKSELKKFGEHLVHKCMTEAAEAMSELQAKAESELASKTATYEAVVEGLQEQVMELHDQLAASAVGGDVSARGDANADLTLTYSQDWSPQELCSNMANQFKRDVRAQKTKVEQGWEQWGSGRGGDSSAAAGSSATPGADGGVPTGAGGIPPPPAPRQVPRPGAKPKAGVLEVMTASGDTVKLEGEYEEIVGATETVTRRVKEQDKVVAPKFPTVNNIKQWHNQMARNLVLASGRTDGAEVPWWNEIMKSGSKFEDFANSGDPRFATLDLKVHAALTQCIREGNKTLAAKLSSLEDQAMSQGKILMGRQLGWLIHDWFRLNPDLKPLFGLQEIADLQWLGDDRIFEFLELWKRIVDNNTIKLDAQQLAEILIGKMRGKTKVLAEDVAYWHRLPAGNDQKPTSTSSTPCSRTSTGRRWRGTTTSGDKVSRVAGSQGLLSPLLKASGRAISITMAVARTQRPSVRLGTFWCQLMRRPRWSSQSVRTRGPLLLKGAGRVAARAVVLVEIPLPVLRAIVASTSKAPATAVMSVLFPMSPRRRQRGWTKLLLKPRGRQRQRLRPKRSCLSMPIDYPPALPLAGVVLSARLCVRVEPLLWVGMPLPMARMVVCLLLVLVEMSLPTPRPRCTTKADGS